MPIIVFEGNIIPAISISATVLVILLAYVAQAIFKAGDLSIRIRRHAFLNPHDVVLSIHFFSTKKKVYVFKNIILAAEIEGKMTPISDDTLAPVTLEQARNLTTDEKGYSLIIKEGKPFDGIFRFHIKQDIDVEPIRFAYLIAIDKDGNRVKARFQLKDIKSQPIRFVKIKEK